LHGPSRRAVLIGGAAAAVACVAGGYELVQDGVLPGKYALARLDGACGSAPPAPAGPAPARQTVGRARQSRGQPNRDHRAVDGRLWRAAARRAPCSQYSPQALRPSPPCPRPFLPPTKPRTRPLAHLSTARRTSLATTCSLAWRHCGGCRPGSLCGTDDPFQPETSQVISRLSAMTGHRVPGGISSGCHDDAFWARYHADRAAFHRCAPGLENEEGRLARPSVLAPGYHLGTPAVLGWVASRTR
jgi:hypothetical protein